MFLDLFEMEALETHLAGCDLLAIQATVFKKSLIYQVHVLSGKAFASNPNASGLVISPLNSIIEEQVSELIELGLSAVHSKDWTKTMQNAW